MHLYRKIKVKLKDKKGSSVIEFAVGLLLFVIFTAFVVDLLVAGGKRFNIGQEATDISRTLAKQGGVMSAVPKGYPGGSAGYLNSGQMIAKIEDRMIRSGFQRYGQGDWNVTLTEYDENGNQVRSGLLTPSSNFKVDYMHSFDIKINGEYTWKLMNVIVGDSLSEQTVTAKRHAVSEYKYDFKTWEGEKY